MELKFVDPRALKENPDKARRSKSNPQADALLLATIKAIGIVQPPIVAPETSAAPALVPVERPKPGMVRVLDHAGEGAEFLHDRHRPHQARARLSSPTWC